MKSLSLALLGVAALFAATACGGTGVDPTTQVQPSPAVSPVQTPAITSDEFAAARNIFEQRCAVCHGPTAEGGTVTVEGTTLKVPNLSGEHTREHSDQDLIEQITNGGDGMPPFRDKLSSEEIEQLVRFIRHEFQQGP